MPDPTHPRLNIGCGHDTRAGYVNLDIYPFPGVDLVHDITTPWPFPDSCFSQILAHHVLEHIRDIVFVVNEAYRCMASQGTLSIAVPWWAGEWAHGDPSHIRQFDHNSFNAFSDWWPDFKHLSISGPWSKVSQEYNFSDLPRFTTFCRRLGISRCKEMVVVLKRP